jgi:hypothetical protein
MRAKRIEIKDAVPADLIELTPFKAAGKAVGGTLGVTSKLQENPRSAIFNHGRLRAWGEHETGSLSRCVR